MAGGALMQLVAYGAQDVYLTGNPSITFFQAVYKKHTNFAMETIEQTVDGAVGNTGHCSLTVGRNGDLVGEMFLELKPVDGLNDVSDNSGASSEWLAERAIKSIDLTIGGQRIDKHYQKWWRMYSELYMDEAKRNQYGKMTSTFLDSGVAVTEERVYLPLIFFFNRNPGLYLPLIALQYHEVKIDINLSDDFNSYFNQSLACWANYIFLDSDERKRFAQTGHEYLIDQVQHTGTDAVVSGSVKQVRLAYNHPVKELVWCFSSTSNGLKNDMWDTSTPQNVCNMTVNPVSTYDVSNLVMNVGPTLTANLSNLVSNLVVTGTSPFEPHVVAYPHLSVQSLSVNSTATANIFADGKGFWVEDRQAGTNTTTGGNCSVGPMKKFKLILNGQDRFKEQLGKYFNQVQPFDHHSGNPYPGIYSYSFALKPEEHQPSGSCNFSRIDNSVASVNMKTSDLTQLNMFAVNYNILRVQSGMGGLAFSN